MASLAWCVEENVDDDCFVSVRGAAGVVAFAFSTVVALVAAVLVLVAAEDVVAVVSSLEDEQPIGIDIVNRKKETNAKGKCWCLIVILYGRSTVNARNDRLQ